MSFRDDDLPKNIYLVLITEARTSASADGDSYTLQDTDFEAMAIL